MPITEQNWVNMLFIQLNLKC